MCYIECLSKHSNYFLWQNDDLFSFENNTKKKNFERFFCEVHILEVNYVSLYRLECEKWRYFLSQRPFDLLIHPLAVHQKQAWVVNEVSRQPLLCWLFLNWKVILTFFFTSHNNLHFETLWAIFFRRCKNYFWTMIDIKWGHSYLP